jgi:hypothetical protein
VLGTGVARWLHVWYRPHWFGQGRFMLRRSKSEMGDDRTNASQHVGAKDRDTSQALQVPVVRLMHTARETLCCKSLR